MKFPTYVITLHRIPHRKKIIVSTVMCALTLPALFITEMNNTEGKIEQRMCVLFIKSQSKFKCVFRHKIIGSITPAHCEHGGAQGRAG